MKKLKETVSFKFREKASIFFTALHPAADGASRAKLLAASRKRDYDATHHCTAWREGNPVYAFGSDDDGEPTGTAGPPMLKVLEGSGMTDIMAVCSRWYGGTKLGTGGLARAYTAGVQGAIAEAERMELVYTVIATAMGTISVPPDLAHLPFAAFGAFEGVEILGQKCNSEVIQVTFSLPLEKRFAFESAWRQRSRGGIVDWFETPRR